MRKIILILALIALVLKGYSQEWKPIITFPDENKSNGTISTKSTRVKYPERKNNYETKRYGNSDITIYRTSVTYDPQYNMCVVLSITNNTTRKIVAIKVGIYYSSKKLQSVDREEVSKNITINQGETEEIFLFGCPKPTYAFMMLGKIFVYFADGTMQKLY